MPLPAQLILATPTRDPAQRVTTTLNVPCCGAGSTQILDDGPEEEEPILVIEVPFHVQLEADALDGHIAITNSNWLEPDGIVNDCVVVLDDAAVKFLAFACIAGLVEAAG